jgi:hypothetical protein
MNITIDDDKLHQWARDNGYVQTDVLAGISQACRLALTMADSGLLTSHPMTKEEMDAVAYAMPLEPTAVSTFLAGVAALEQPDITRAQVEAAFRAMLDKYTVGKEQGPALAAGRALLDRLGVQRRPDIPESQFAECLKLLEDLPATSDEFVARLKA